MDPISAPLTLPNLPTPKISFFKGKLKFLIGIVFLLLIASVILVVIFQSKGQAEKTVAVEEEPMVKVSELPIGLDLLKNPIINQWRGSFDQATLISKDEESITIEKNGSKLVIPVDSKFTWFFTNDKTKTNARISLNDILVGSKVRGDFFAIPSEDDKNKIVGGAITYQEKPE